MEKEQIIRTEYSDIMQKSYIDYAMSVIIARALPDVRDGLKAGTAPDRCMICMSLAFAMTSLTGNVPVSSAIPWVNIIPTEIPPSMRPW